MRSASQDGEAPGAVLSFILSLERHVHAIMKSSTRVLRGSPALGTKVSGTALSRTHQPRVLAAAGARSSHWQEGNDCPQRLAPPAPQLGGEDITLGRSAGGLGKEGAEASHRAGLEVRGLLAAQQLLLLGDEGGGGAAVTRTESASWACFRFAGRWARPAHRKQRKPLRWRPGGAGLAPLTLRVPLALSLRTCRGLRPSALQHA